MIHHLSIAARDPKKAAGVLADLMGGKAVPFPPNPGSFFALQLDDHGSGVEVYPAGTELEPNGDVGGSFVKHARERGFGSTHFALSVKTDAKTVEDIARRVGVSQPYLFQLFGTKKDLFIAALRHGFMRTLRTFMNAAASVPADADAPTILTGPDLTI